MTALVNGALVARHLHLIDEVPVPPLHVLPQSALVVVRGAASVVAHIRPGLFVHRLDVVHQLPLYRKPLQHESEIVLIEDLTSNII